jgi:hypothetical protein
MIRRRGRWGLLGVALALAAHLGAGAAVVLADGLPRVASVAPQAVVSDGRPLHLRVAGTNLSQVISVTLVPAVPGISFTVAGDTSLLLTLPATIPADTYTMYVTATQGTSDPTSAPAFTVDLAAASDATSPPPPPRDSFAATPTVAAAPTGGVAHAAVPQASSHPSGTTLTPLLLPPVGLALGGLGYLLWGRPGRLTTASRQDLAAHLVGRPTQALRIGRICVHCGRLHLVIRTRRDLWHAGQFCSAACFVAAQEEDAAAREDETAASARLTAMFGDAELDRGQDRPSAGGADAPRPGTVAAVAAPAVATD